MVDVAHLRGQVEIRGAEQSAQQLRLVGGGFDELHRKAQQVSGPLDQTGQALGRTGQQAQTASGQFRGVQQGLQQLSPVALGSAGAVVAVGKGMQASLDASIAWNSSLAGVAKTLDTTGLSVEEAEVAVAQMGTELRSMAQTIPVAATELAGIAEAAGQLGIAREDVIGFTEVMAKLAVTTDLTSNQAATSFAQFLNITGSATSTVDELASSLVFLGNNSATTESRIIDMAQRIASAGSQAEFTDAQILGMAAALSSLGLEAEAGGTAASRLILSIRDAAIEGGDALDTFATVAGQSAESFAAAWESSPQEALAAFLNGLAQIDAAGGNSQAVLDDLGLSGIRVSDTIRRASGDVSLLTGLMDGSTAAFAANTAANKEAGQRFETTASQVQLARNEMNEAAIVAGDVLAPAYVELLGLGADLVTSLSDQVVAFGELKRAMTELDPTELGSSYVDAVLTPFTLGPDIVIGLGNALFGLGGATAEAAAANERSIPIWQAIVDLFEEIRGEIGLHGPTWDEYIAAQEKARAEQIAANREHQNLINTMNLEIDAAAALASEWDEQRLQALTLQDAAMGLAGAYQQALDVQRAFQSQSSEFASTQGAIEDAIAAVQEKQAQGIPLSQKEISLLENHDEVLARLVGGQQDATIEAGLAALAAGELMLAQDELNKAIENGVEDLGPYKQRVEDAQAALGNMGSAAGDTKSAQDDLAASINGPLISAIGDLTRSVEYISKPWLIEIDAATDAAEREIERLKGIIAAGAILPVSIVSGDASGIVPGGGVSNFAEGGVSEGGVALVGEEGPELVFLPRGAEVMTHSDSKRFLGGFANGTGGSLGIGGGGAASVGSAMGADFGVAFSAGAANAMVPIPPQALFGTEATAVSYVTGLWESAVNAIESTFVNNPFSLFSGEFGANLQEEIAAYEAFLAALLQAGFSMDSPEYQEAFADYQELLRQFELATAIAGTESAQDFWDAWYAAQPREWQYPEWGSDAADFGGEMGGRFWEAWAESGMAFNGRDAFARGVEALGEEGLAAYAAALAQYPEIADQVIDDIVAAAQEGRITWEEALALMAQVPAETLVPALESLRDALAVDLTEALLQFGPDSPQVQSILAALGVIDEQLASIPDTVVAVGEAGLAQLEQIFREYPGVAKDMVDDLIDAVLDGRIPFEDAMALLANVPEEDLIPALERLEEQLTVKLAEALLSLGPDSPEVQAILAALGLIEAAADAAGSAAQEAFEGIASAGNNYGNVGGDNSTGGGGGGGSGGQPVTAIGTSKISPYVNPFGDGGIVTQPTLALIGERGETEGVFPLSRAQDFGFGGGMDDATIKQLADEIGKAVVKHAGRNETYLDSRAIAGGVASVFGSGAISGQARNR